MSEELASAPVQGPTQDTSRLRRTRQVPPAPVATPPVLVANGCNLLEPHELIWFYDAKPREVARITKWIQAQIEAGLLKRA